MIASMLAAAVLSFSATPAGTAPEAAAWSAGRTILEARGMIVPVAHGKRTHRAEAGACNTQPVRHTPCPNAQHSNALARNAVPASEAEPLRADAMPVNVHTALGD